MVKFFKYLSIVFFMIMVAAFIDGCVNYDQKTVLNEDGSGTMKIHYWTSMKNFSMGTTLGKFDFEEEKAKANFTSSNSEVTDIKVEEKLDDSTKHVNLDVKFKDINEINRAKGFESAKATWKESSDGMELKYTLAQDTAAAKQMGASDNTITYTFEMPSDIISTNATRKDGNTLIWEYKLSDLTKDIEMTANVKKKGGKFCGIIGFISAIGFIGFSYMSQRGRKLRKSK